MNIFVARSGPPPRPLVWAVNLHWLASLGDRIPLSFWLRLEACPDQGLNLDQGSEIASVNPWTARELPKFPVS